MTPRPPVRFTYREGKRKKQHRDNALRISPRFSIRRPASRYWLRSDPRRRIVRGERSALARFVLVVVVVRQTAAKLPAGRLCAHRGQR